MRLFSRVATTAVALMVTFAPVVASAQPPATPAAATPAADAPPARLPFPPGATHAYVDLQRVLAQSTAGQAANKKVQEMTEAKLAEIEATQTQLNASQTRLQQSGGVLSSEAQFQLQTEIETLSTRVQRQTQDAEAEVGRFQQGQQIEFNAKLAPALDQVGATRGLSFIFSVAEGGIAWANPALDVTADVILALDAAPPTP
ncbi:MAG: OmpH family outer membrane protein [Acidobacteria bacterium]|nr:OmpH family outer membrane protein [Acidobacteriota bacterium]